MQNARPGDVVLYHRPSSWANFRRDPLGTIMTALIHFTTRSKWNHASLAVEGGLVIEATSKGVVATPLEDTLDETLVVPVTYTDLDDLHDALDYARRQVGTEYGELNAFWCGLRNLFPGRLQVSWGNTIICSELVAEALVRAGDDRIVKDPGLYSPGDIADALGAPRR